MLTNIKFKTFVPNTNPDISCQQSDRFPEKQRVSKLYFTQILERMKHQFNLKKHYNSAPTFWANTLRFVVQYLCLFHFCKQSLPPTTLPSRDLWIIFLIIPHRVIYITRRYNDDNVLIFSNFTLCSYKWKSHHNYYYLYYKQV